MSTRVPAGSDDRPLLNALTVDVEDYFQVTAFAGSVKREDWTLMPSRVADNTRRILDLADEYSVKATFFVLGWVAERNPGLVKDIMKRGHEVASHGYGHALVNEIGPAAFREDIRRSKQLLEDLTGEGILGYRAPSYSITRESMWAFDILLEEGFVYDSSIFPIIHDIYGIPNAKRFPFEVAAAGGVVREFPMSTIEVPGIKYRIPVAGGGYLRLFPSWLLIRAMRHINNSEKQPAVLYFHPWEIDPEQPRIKAGLRSRFRHYLNLKTTYGKVEHILSQLSFAPMSQVLGLGQTVGAVNGS